MPPRQQTSEIEIVMDDSSVMRLKTLGSSMEDSLSPSLSESNSSFSSGTRTPPNEIVDLDQAKENGSETIQNELHAPVLKTFPPPLHTCALIVCLLAIILKNLPSQESLDQVATLSSFTHVNFDGLVSLPMVIAIRMLFAAIMLGQGVSVYLWGCWEANTDYFPGSKLTVAKGIKFRGALHPEGNFFSGFKCIATFTLWCWLLEGTAFFLAGMIPLLHLVAPNVALSPWIFRLAFVLWEITAPVAILVSAVVKYALWPMALKQGDNVKLLQTTEALLQHNLNSIAALVEVGLLGGLPVRLCDFAIPPLYGISYLLFSYSMMYSWTDRHHGAQFVYPFFDTTLGATTSLALVALLAVLLASFILFSATELLWTELPPTSPVDDDWNFSLGVVAPLTAVLVLSAGVCRFRD